MFSHLNVAARFARRNMLLGGDGELIRRLGRSFISVPSLTRAFTIAYYLLNVPFQFAKLRDLGVGRASHVFTLGTRLQGLKCLLRSTRSDVLV